LAGGYRLIAGFAKFVGRANGAISMSKGKWRFTTAEIKRLVRAIEESGLGVVQVRVDDVGVTVNTQPASDPLDDERPNTFDQVLGDR
jgi:hypothetical protein